MSDAHAQAAYPRVPSAATRPVARGTPTTTMLIPNKLSPSAVRWVKVALFVLGLLPLARLVAGYPLGWLGTNPLEVVTRSTGTWTLVSLLITLSITPLRKWFNAPWLVQLRRMCGLFAYFYCCLHLTTYVWFDQFFDWSEIWKDVMKRRFITVGFAAFVLMTPLAFTSWNGAIKRMGARNWQRLHKAVYLIASCGVVHYYWLVKRDITQPVLFGLVLATLLGVRVVWAARKRAGT
jgi:methionine sulfoxide reductase heme-binding subunit